MGQNVIELSELENNEESKMFAIVSTDDNGPILGIVSKFSRKTFVERVRSLNGSL